MLLALALAVIPQMTGRTDVRHAIYTIGPCLIGLASLAEWSASRIRLPGLGAVPALLTAALLVRPMAARLRPLPARLRPPPPDPALVIGVPQASGIAEPELSWATDRRALIPVVQRLSGPSDAVYFGTNTHERVTTNETDLYFLTQRRPGTRYTQFDPNMVSRREVQEEMIQQLQERNVSLVVLSPCCVLDEGPQQLILPGSHLLDEYIASHFHEVQRVGQYSVRVRKIAPPPAPPAGSRALSPR
jgi:hypothetical protein